MPRRRRRRSHSAASGASQDASLPQTPGPRAQRPQGAGPRPQQPSPGPRPPQAPAQRAEANVRTKALSIPPNLKASIEMAAELAKKELCLNGKVGSMAVFVYPDGDAGLEAADRSGAVTTVSLSNRNELQKEAVRKRIREKVLAETISTVILASDGKKERASHGPGNPAAVSGSIVITGVTPSANASASVAYSFDKGTKNFSLWDLRWLDTTADNYFLHNVFGAQETKSSGGGNRPRRN